jgi:hypothetical protein
VHWLGTVQGVEGTLAWNVDGLWEFVGADHVAASATSARQALTATSASTPAEENGCSPAGLVPGS